MNKVRFIEYVEQTIGPDLKEAGRVETARDLYSIVKFLKGAKTSQGFNKLAFMSYLLDTLIPDLKDAGYVATAEDFETGVSLLQDEV